MPDDLTPSQATACATSPGPSGPGAFSPGVVLDLPFDDYLQLGDCSKSSLWKLYTKSPRHALIDVEPNNAMAMGSAVHCAVLEPDAFEERYQRGPDDRRGQRWKEWKHEHGDDALTSGDYDGALAIRDALMSDPTIRRLTGPGTVREVSAFGVDPETGLQVRTRPDAFVPDLKILVELKVTTDASAHNFGQYVAPKLGYHAGEALYRDVWQWAGEEVDAFVFIVVEKTEPFEFQIFELPADEVNEGRAIMRKALNRWAECKAANDWPGYPRGVQTLAFKPWDFRETEPQTQTKELPDDYGTF